MLVISILCEQKTKQNKVNSVREFMFTMNVFCCSCTAPYQEVGDVVISSQRERVLFSIVLTHPNNTRKEVLYFYNLFEPTSRTLSILQAHVCFHQLKYNKTHPNVPTTCLSHLLYNIYSSSATGATYYTLSLYFFLFL